MILDDYKEINSNLLMVAKDPQNMDTYVDKIFDTYNKLISDESRKKGLEPLKKAFKDAVSKISETELREEYLEYYHTVSKSEKNIAVSSNKFSKYDPSYYETYKARFIYDSLVNFLTETGIDKYIYNNNDELKRYAIKKINTLTIEIQAGRSRSIEAVSNVIPNTIFPLFLDHARVIVNDNPANNAGAYTDGENIYIDVSFLLHYGPFNDEVIKKFNLNPYPLNGYHMLKNIVFHEIGHLLFDDVNYGYAVSGNILQNRPFESYTQFNNVIKRIVNNEPSIRDIVNLNFVNNMFKVSNILADITINNLLIYQFDRLSYQKTSVPLYNKAETISLPLGVYFSKTDKNFNHFKAFERYIEISRQYFIYLFENKKLNCQNIIDNIVNHVKSHTQDFVLTNERFFKKSLIDIITDEYFQQLNQVVLNQISKEFNLESINIVKNNEKIPTVDEIIAHIYKTLMMQFQSNQQKQGNGPQNVSKVIEGLRRKNQNMSGDSADNQQQMNDQENQNGQSGHSGSGGDDQESQNKQTDGNSGDNNSNQDDKTKENKGNGNRDNNKDKNNNGKGSEDNKKNDFGDKTKDNTFDSNDEANLVKKAKEEMSKALDKAVEDGKYKNSNSSLNKVETRSKSKKNSDIKSYENNTKARASSVIDKANRIQNGKGVGTEHIIDCVRAVIDRLNQYNVEWDKLFRNLIYNKYYSDMVDAKRSDYSQPNIPLVGVKNNIENILGTQTYIPSEKFIKPGYFLALIDVSGSVPLEVEKAFLSELYGLLETAKKDKFDLYLDILYVDTDKCDKVSYKSSDPEKLKDDITKLGIPQGGGTYLSGPLFKTVEEMSKDEDENKKKLQNLSTVMILTDGCLGKDDIANFTYDKLAEKVFCYNNAVNSTYDEIRDRIVYVISDEDSDMYKTISSNYDKYGKHCIIAKKDELTQEEKFVDVTDSMTL